MTVDFTYFHWYYSIKNKHLPFNLGTALFILGFLSIAKPFGIGQTNLASQLAFHLILLVFAFLWPLVSYATDLLNRSVMPAGGKSNPKIGIVFFFLKMILAVHAVLLIRLMLCDWSCIDGYEYTEMWFAVTLILGISYLVYTFHAKQLFYKNLIGKGPETGLLTLKNKAGKTFQLDPKVLLYVKSEDNYVKMIFLGPNKNVRTTLFRMTLSAVETQLGGYSQFIRIHRSYMVNLSFLKHTDISSTLEIAAGAVCVRLPVSRKYRNSLLGKVH